jgi:hypothetical protein
LKFGKGKNDDRAVFAQLLDRFEDALKKKRPHLAKKKANVPAHRSLAAAANLVKLGCELLPHPPYSLDLAPRRFFLFPKKLLGGERFASNEEVITEIGAYFVEFDKSYFLEGLKKLESRWAKCIELKGDYVEK